MIAIKSTVLKLISQKVPLELIKLERQFENATKQFSRYRMFLFINNYYWTKLYHLLYRYTFVDQYIINEINRTRTWIYRIYPRIKTFVKSCLFNDV